MITYCLRDAGGAGSEDVPHRSVFLANRAYALSCTDLFLIIIAFYYHGTHTSSPVTIVTTKPHSRIPHVRGVLLAVYLQIAHVLHLCGTLLYMTIGDSAPDFSLPDQTGKTHTLADYRGRWLLLYFYPRDLTPGCTVEACTIRDSFADFEARNAAVLGVSADSVASHQKFAQKHGLPFPLLADTEKVLCEAYGVWGKKKFMGREYMGISRVSFLIDPAGTIAKVYDPVKPSEHAGEVLADIALRTKK